MTAPAEHTNPGTAVATRAETPKGLVAIFSDDRVRARVIPLLLPGASYERVLGEIQLLSRENPAILNCTAESLIRAVARAVTWGGTIGEDVHIVPFNTKVKVRDDRGREREEWETRAVAMQDYKFKAELIVRAGGARSIDAQCVYEKEHFVYEQGAYPRLIHHPICDVAARGKLIAAYAVAHISVRVPPKVYVLGVAEIDQIRRKFSKQWKPKDNERPEDCPPWYAMKSCVHRVAKLLPKNPKLTQLLGRITDDDDLGEDAFPDTGPVATIARPETPALPARGTAGGALQAMHGYDETEMLPIANARPIATDDAAEDDADTDARIDARIRAEDAQLIAEEDGQLPLAPPRRRPRNAQLD